MTQLNLSTGPLTSGAGYPPGAYVPGAYMPGGAATSASSGGDARSMLGRSDATLELAYGCVDWFIYVTDSVAISPMTQLGGGD